MIRNLFLVLLGSISFGNILLGDSTLRPHADKAFSEIEKNLDTIKKAIEESHAMHGVKERKTKKPIGVMKTKDDEWRLWSGTYKIKKDHTIAKTPAWIKKIHDNKCSEILRNIKSSLGNLSEIFVMDTVGGTACYSDPTTDFDQGNEAKYWVPFKENKTVHEGELELDRSTKTKAIQYSYQLKEGGKLIGVVTIGSSAKEK